MAETRTHFAEIAQQPFRLKVAGMDCGSCALTIEQGLRQLDGVDDVEVDYTTQLAQGHARVPLQRLRDRIEELGYSVVDDTLAAARGDPLQHERLRGFVAFLWERRFFRTSLALGAALLAAVPIELAGGPALVAPLALLVSVVVGYPIAHRGVRALLYARRITIELLMAVAVLGAIGIGAWGEAAAVVLLFTLGEALEAYAAQRSRDSLAGLLELRPAQATVIRTHSDNGNEHRTLERVSVSELRVGDLVLVKPGERIAADGRIVHGTSAIDESAITGESMPVTRAPGEDVFAGTMNGAGTLEIEVASRAEDFTISQIARLVEQAQAQRSPAERLVDRFARWYTPAVVALAVLVAVGPPILLGQPFIAAVDGAPGWFYRGLTLLIIACPCALVISIPVTVVSALTRLAHLGILVKGGAQLDELSRVRVFAFDKTGTLTRGRPSVTAVRSLQCSHAQNAGDCAPCEDMLAMAASVERGSDHPFAHAVIAAADERRLEHRYETARDLHSVAGRGVSGTLAGKRITVGHRALFEGNAAIDAPELAERPPERSVLWVGEDERVLGYIEVEDEIRGSTREALEALKNMDPSYRFVMLTGDRQATADSVGLKVGGMDEIHAELLPAQKLDVVRGLEAAHGTVAMVGDGINDAPALAAARLGVAMGGAGSQQAMEVADVVLMQDDLSCLARAVSISRKTQRLVKENIALSLGLKLAFLALALPGIATLWMAVLADVGATVAVTLNGMRVLRMR